MIQKENEKVFKLAVTGLMAALCYVAFTYVKIPIPTIGGDMVALHVGNAFCVLAALLLGGTYGGVAGALGMTIADLMDPAYVTSAPKTFILKFLIGLIAGFIAHRVAKITDDHDAGYIFRWSLIASAVSLGFNVIADPVFGYFYKNYVLGVESSAAKIMSTLYKRRRGHRGGGGRLFGHPAHIEAHGTFLPHPLRRHLWNLQDRRKLQ